MDTILNFISVVGTFLFTFGLLYLIQRYTLGFIPFLQKEIKQTITVGDVLFSIISLAVIIGFVDFYRPY